MTGTKDFMTASVPTPAHSLCLQPLCFVDSLCCGMGGDGSDTKGLKCAYKISVPHPLLQSMLLCNAAVIKERHSVHGSEASPSNLLALRSK